MIKTIKRTKYEIMAFDLENTVDEESVKKLETRMYLGCLIGEDTKENDNCYFYSIEDFVDKLEELTRRNRKHNYKENQTNIMIYIWNLAHEWSFIYPELEKRGLQFGKVKPNRGKSGNTFESVCNPSCSSVWSASIKFGSSDGIIVFRDLQKLLGGSLKNAAKSFKTKTQKGDDEGNLIDYTAPRPVGYIPSELEKQYNFNDCRIIIELLQKIDELDDKYFWTSISAASWSASRMIGETYKNKRKPMKEYRAKYPLLSKEEEEFVRHSVSGGICYATPYHQMQTVEKVFHIDAHQMHPSQMYTKYFPYGKGEYYKGDFKKYRNKICCVHARISYTGVKLHSQIRLIGNDFANGKEIYYWSFEEDIMHQCYENLVIEYIDGYAYNRCKLPWRDLLAENYMKRKECKAAGDNAGQLRYKLLNNSFYGKMLEKGYDIIYINTINKHGLLDTIKRVKEQKEKGPLDCEDEVASCGKYAYLPVGSCIPAYSRVALLTIALMFDYQDVVYFDTDSVFIKYTLKVDDVLKSGKINFDDFFGGWGLEGDKDENGKYTGIHAKMKAICPKRYITEDNHGFKDIKCAGLKPEEFLKDQMVKTGYCSEDTKDKELSKAMKTFLKDIDINKVQLDDITVIVKQRVKAKGGTLIVAREKYINKIMLKNIIETYAD